MKSLNLTNLVLLQKALTSSNILSGFGAIGIWPFDPQAMTKKTSPTEGLNEITNEE